MIIVQLNGGLGNQMFQYAAGRSLALKHNTSLYLDIAKFSTRNSSITPRNYELEIFSHSAKIHPNQLIKFGKISILFSGIMKYFGGPYFCIEKKSGFNKNFLNFPSNAYLIGYWQSHKYFDSVANELIRDFEFNKPLNFRSSQILEKIKKDNSVALHIRRGDYVTNTAANNFHGIIPLSYYHDAIKLISNINKDLSIYIFSDDPDWCRKNLKIPKLNTTFIDHNHESDSWQDLYLMGFCKHHILANSSFSWWGGWFGDQHWGRNRSVIYPRKWFSKDVDNADRAPSHWISI